MQDTESSSSPSPAGRDHDARRLALASRLWAESTHKKFIANRGREPLRPTVNTKSAIDMLARSLLESLGNPLVPYLPQLSGARSGEAPAGEGGPWPRRTDRDVVIAKGRRTALPSWRNLSPELQLLFGLVALDERMETLAFSLNLGTALLDSLTPGSTAARNTVRNRISRALKAKVGRNVPFVVVLEETADGRLHAHGVVQVSRAEQPQTDSALRLAGGTWTAARGGTHQLRLTPVWGSYGWWHYVMKCVRRFDDDRKADWIGWSLPAKRAAVELHRQVRRWWALNRDDMTIRHSMHFFLSDLSLAEELRAFV